MSGSGRRRQPELVAIDYGTSGLRVALVTASGSIRRIESIRVPTFSSKDGAAEVDCDQLWLATCALVSNAIGGACVRGVAVASQQGWVFTDGRLRPVRRALLWSDQRGGPESRELRRTVGGAGESRAGRRYVRELAAGRLAWLSSTEPEAFARLRWVLSVKDYLVSRLTGRATTDPTHASYTGFLDVRERTWASELVAASGITVEHLPQVLEATACAGLVSEQAARETSLAPGIPVAVGGPDGTLGAVGAGAVVADVAVDVAGTTDVVFQTSALPPGTVSESLIVNAHCLGELWTLGGPTGMTGGAVRWLAGLLGWRAVSDAYREVGRQVSAAEIGASGVRMVPTLTGGRFPDWNEASTGFLAGLKIGHGPVEILRAAEEGSAFVVREALDELGRHGLSMPPIRVVGGAARQSWLMQLRADAWGRPVLSIAEAEATIIGAAMVAGVASGTFMSVLDAANRCVHVQELFSPDPDRVDAYAQVFADWRRLKALTFDTTASTIPPSSKAVNEHG